MEQRDKQVISILTLIFILTGLVFIGFNKYNNNTIINDTPTTQIMVTGNGNTGIGDVQNVQQVQVMGANGQIQTVTITKNPTTGETTQTPTPTNTNTQTTTQTKVPTTTDPEPPTKTDPVQTTNIKVLNK